MTAQEIIKAVKNFYEEKVESEDSDYSDAVSEFAYEERGSIPGVGNFVEVDQKGGEGQGDDWWSVKHFPDHNVHLYVRGYYQSYNGTEFDDWDAVSEVIPQKVIRIEWIRKA
jgi:hypothetical protein